MSRPWSRRWPTSRQRPPPRRGPSHVPSCLTPLASARYYLGAAQARPRYRRAGPVREFTADTIYQYLTVPGPEEIVKRTSGMAAGTSPGPARRLSAGRRVRDGAPDSTGVAGRLNRRETRARRPAVLWLAIRRAVPTTQVVWQTPSARHLVRRPCAMREVSLHGHRGATGSNRPAPPGTLLSSLRNDRTWERVTPAVATRAEGGVSPASTAAGSASVCVARATGRASQGPTNIGRCAVCAAADEAGGAARNAVPAGPIVRHAAAPGAWRSRLPTRRSTTTSGDPPPSAFAASQHNCRPFAPSALAPFSLTSVGAGVIYLAPCVLEK